MENHSEYEAGPRLLGVEAIATVCAAIDSAWKNISSGWAVSSWILAPERDRDRIIGDVLTVGSGTRTAAQLHEDWLRQMEAAGWVHGPERDTREFKHPNVLPWAELPARTRIEMELLVATIRVLYPHLGESLAR